jgi:hypothetical protein
MCRSWSPTEREKRTRQLTADGPTVRLVSGPFRLPPGAVSAAASNHRFAALRQREGDQQMSRYHASNARPSGRHPARIALIRSHRHGARQRAALLDDRASDRARISASLLAASHALVSDPDAAALLLDGALSQMLELWARRAHIHLSDRSQALSALDDRAPAIAWRLRLALQAHHPEARLAHCWAMLDLLTGQTAPHEEGGARIARSALDHNDYRNDYRMTRRKGGQSHVS